MNLKRLAGALSFAHLAGAPQAQHASVDGDDTDDKKGKRAAATDDDTSDQDREDGDAKGNRAEGDDDNDTSAAGDDPDKKDGDDDEPAGKKKGKKAKTDEGKGDEAADADDPDADDDEEEMHGKSAAASARRRERERCAAIMGSKYAAHNVVLAASLAFNTSMTRSQAIETLRKAPAATSPNGSRSARNPSIGASEDLQVDQRASRATSWDRAMAKAQGRN